MDEDGKDINPHIPQYISDAPWYTEPKGPTLKHQRPQEERQIKYSGITDWYRKGVNKEKVATRYRKGACENCGAVTHKKRDCLERPRRVIKIMFAKQFHEFIAFLRIFLSIHSFKYYAKYQTFTFPLIQDRGKVHGDQLRP